jgi:hypothetical protein
VRECAGGQAHSTVNHAAPRRDRDRAGARGRSSPAGARRSAPVGRRATTGASTRWDLLVEKLASQSPKTLANLGTRACAQVGSSGCAACVYVTVARSLVRSCTYVTVARVLLQVYNGVHAVAHACRFLLIPSN